jgi:DNA-binding NtrC family response regulator
MVQIKSLKDIRKEHIQEVLRSTGGDVDRASKILGVTAASLRHMVKEYGLSSDESVEPGASRNSP